MNSVCFSSGSFFFSSSVTTEDNKSCYSIPSNPVILSGFQHKIIFFSKKHEGDMSFLKITDLSKFRTYMVARPLRGLYQQLATKQIFCVQMTILPTSDNIVIVLNYTVKKWFSAQFGCMAAWYTHKKILYLQAKL